MILEEDITVFKLKGYNVVIKFNDGEVLPISVDFNIEDFTDWFVDVEDFINSSQSDKNFPVAGLSINRSTIKYVMKI